jgi:hypothetical protein
VTQRERCKVSSGASGRDLPRHMLIERQFRAGRSRWGCTPAAGRFFYELVGQTEGDGPNRGVSCGGL